MSTADGRSETTTDRGLDEETVTRTVAGIWQDVLRLPDGYQDATFIELSGQSINAVMIVNRIADELGLDVDVVTLFDDPNLAEFTEHVVSLATEVDTAAETA